MADIRYYDVILKPIVTEKSMNAMGEKKYTFMVHPEANKSQMITSALFTLRLSSTFFISFVLTSACFSSSRTMNLFS